MSITGVGSLSLRRKDVAEQKSIALGIKKLVMAHKSTLGDTGINLSSLVIPPEMSSLGFTNPNSAEILAANLKFYRNNIRVVSSHKGLLMDYLSYDVASSSRINFTGFTAEDGEIFVITFDENAKTGITMVDAAPLNSTGTLAVGVADYNVGTPFEVNKYPVSQVGSVLVFRNGQIQFRNPSNGLTGGNYQEVQAGGGLGTIIRFNNAPVGIADNILVVGNGLLVYKPDGSVLAEVENLAGQLDRLVPTVAALAGVPETDFQTAPNNVDLKAFGDEVIDHEARLDALESKAALTFLLADANATSILNGATTKLSNILAAPSEDTGLGWDSVGKRYITPRKGLYLFSGGIVYQGTVWVSAGASNADGRVYVNGILRFIFDGYQTPTANAHWVYMGNGAIPIRLNANDIVELYSFNASGSTANVGISAFGLTWIGE